MSDMIDIGTRSLGLLGMNWALKVENCRVFNMGKMGIVVEIIRGFDRRGMQ
jgi:hypothetical protein